MDLTSVFWKAIHSDKVVDSKTDRAYAQVRRGTLQKLVFYTNEETKYEFKRPDNVDSWPIRWRLRTRINHYGSAVEERHWVIDNGKFNLLGEDLKLHVHDSCTDCDKKPVSITPTDLL